MLKKKRETNITLHRVWLAIIVAVVQAKEEIKDFPSCFFFLLLVLQYNLATLFVKRNKMIQFELIEKIHGKIFTFKFLNFFFFQILNFCSIFELFREQL